MHAKDTENTKTEIAAAQERAATFAVAVAQSGALLRNITVSEEWNRRGLAHFAAGEISKAADAMKYVTQMEEDLSHPDVFRFVISGSC